MFEFLSNKTSSWVLFGKTFHFDGGAINKFYVSICLAGWKKKIKFRPNQKEYNYSIRHSFSHSFVGWFIHSLDFTVCAHNFFGYFISFFLSNIQVFNEIFLIPKINRPHRCWFAFRYVVVFTVRIFFSVSLLWTDPLVKWRWAVDVFFFLLHLVVFVCVQETNPSAVFVYASFM